MQWRYRWHDPRGIDDLRGIADEAPQFDQSMVDEAGRIRQAARITTDYEHICLNPDNPTFVAVDPAIMRERDKQRILCSFEVDGNRRLLVTATDTLTGKPLLVKHPVVRL